MLNVFNRSQTNKIEPAAKLFSQTDLLSARRAEAWLASRLKRGQHERFTEEVELTPALAELLLQRNPANRVVKDAVVQRYAADIRNGFWQVNGEPIILSRDGLLNDGQHRCFGVITAGRPIIVNIAFGYERASRLTLDQGATRTTGDFLGMDGAANANHQAVVAGLLWQYDTSGTIGDNTRNRGTKAQVIEKWHSSPGILDSIHVVSRKGSGVLGGIGSLAFCHYVFARIDAKAADAFMKKLVEGDELSKKDPIYVARQRIIGDRRLKLSERIELIFRAWNRSRQRRGATIAKIHGQLPVLER